MQMVYTTQKIAEVRGVETPCDGGLTYHVELTLTCGHVKLPKRPKQTTRMRLYECECVPDKESGTTNKVRCASDNLQATCNLCGADFVIQVPGEEKGD